MPSAQIITLHVVTLPGSLRTSFSVLTPHSPLPEKQKLQCATPSILIFGPSGCKIPDDLDTVPGCPTLSAKAAAIIILKVTPVSFSFKYHPRVNTYMPSNLMNNPSLYTNLAFSPEYPWLNSSIL
jgi:hypothetical protein